MKTINSEQAAEAFWQLFREHPELQQQPLPDALDEALEPSATALLLSVAAERWQAWKDAEPAIRSLAAALLMDFFAKLTTGHPTFARKRWSVKSLAKKRQALEVLAIELAASHPQQARPH